MRRSLPSGALAPSRSPCAKADSHSRGNSWSPYLVVQTRHGELLHNSYERRLLRFTTPTLLIVDDLGLRPLTGEEGIDPYEIVRRRYERAAQVETVAR
ncbi:ATP-binding protein [Corallococcus sp. RDP092CA]|uniref:ATP-binding protein n=1 Tax=Corallococcus sp. RDP092CA TaxID=3109369 RepID=UPI0035B1E814